MAQLRKHFLIQALPEQMDHYGQTWQKAWSENIMMKWRWTNVKQAMHTA